LVDLTRYQALDTVSQWLADARVNEG